MPHSPPDGSASDGAMSCSIARWVASGVTHAQDHDLLACNAIPDDVWPDSDQFAHLGARHSATAMGKVDEAVRGREQGLGQTDRGLWIEVTEVVVGAPDPTQGAAGPDDAHELGFRRGDSLAPDQSPEPFTDRFMRHDPPCSKVRFGFGIEACLGRLVGRQIENRPNLRLSHAEVPPRAGVAQIRADAVYAGKVG